MANNGNEADDDYMGDLSLFLPRGAPTSTSQHSRKHHQPNNSNSKPTRPKGLTWQEQRRLDRERKQREEDERTMAGLAAAIPETNIGYKLLQRMGYNPSGSGGPHEPVGVQIKRSRAGIGVLEEWEVKRKEGEVKRKEVEVKRRKKQEETETVAEEFGSRQRSKWRNRKVVWDYQKAQAALAQLENVEVVDKEKEEEEEEGEEEQGEEEEEEEEEVITEEVFGFSPYASAAMFHQWCLELACMWLS